MMVDGTLRQLPENGSSPIVSLLAKRADKMGVQLLLMEKARRIKTSYVSEACWILYRNQERLEAVEQLRRGTVAQAIAGTRYE